MKYLVLAAACALLMGTAAQALTVQPTDTATFNAECGGCEIVVPTIRGGNQALNGNWEVAINDNGVDNKQIAWGSGQSLDWQLSYTAASTALQLTVGGVMSQTMVDLSAANVIYVRTRAEDEGSTELGGDVTLVNDGTSPDQTVWLRLTDFVGAGGDFDLSGTVLFDFDGTDARGSRYIAQFKIGEIEMAPIPLPASGLLLLGAVGALALRARRRAA